MPVVIPASFADEWLRAQGTAAELVGAACAASQPLSERIRATAEPAPDTLF